MFLSFSGQVCTGHTEYLVIYYLNVKRKQKRGKSLNK